MICENCGCEHTRISNSNRFCSKKCGYAFSTKHKREQINKQVSEKIKALILTQDVGCMKKKRTEGNESVSCEHCNIVFTAPIYKKRRFCGNKCAIQFGQNSRTEGIRNAIKNGTWKSGWQSNRNESSYAEKYFEQAFNALNIAYEREVKIGKYFVDFLFRERKVILEVDGKQHLTEQHQLRDKERDEHISSMGWKIIRINWLNVNNPENAKAMQEQIGLFVQRIGQCATNA